MATGVREALIPVRGRRQLNLACNVVREGWVREALIPVRGRRLWGLTRRLCGYRRQRSTNPRKGTETVVRPTQQTDSCLGQRSTNPRKGTETVPRTNTNTNFRVLSEKH